MTFQIQALDPSKFIPLYTMSDSALASHRAMWADADAEPGYPCRISLEDAPKGSRVLLVNFNHHPSDSPYRSSHAIYVNPEAVQARPKPGVVPSSISSRLISWRAFNAKGLMVDADVLDGKLLASRLTDVFSNKDVEYVHLHNARPGCYAARVTRKDGLT